MNTLFSGGLPDRPSRSKKDDDDNNNQSNKKKSSKTSNDDDKNTNRHARTFARESDPLLLSKATTSRRGHNSTTVRRRMSQSPETTARDSLQEPMLPEEGSSSSIPVSMNATEHVLKNVRHSPEPEQHFVYNSMSNPIDEDDDADDDGDADSGESSSHSQPSDEEQPRQPISRPVTPKSSEYGEENRSTGTHSRPALLEIPEEIYAVRKAALQVLKPLTKTWVVISVGFSLTVLFGMARWTRLLPGLPFWFILLPSWAAHGGLVFLHVQSAQALSAFIAEANESRQRPDSRDHLNRTEYLPLLQRSLKFGLKTGILSFVMFVFEILIYIRLARNTMLLTVVFVPLWLLVLSGIVDGLICKTQHGIRVVCWVLTFSAMMLLVLKVDFGFELIRWRVVVSPIVLVLSIASGSLVYIVYGHQVGYYQLTESQLTAGNLYSLAALICIVLLVMIGEVIPLTRPVEVETRLFVVVLAPLVVCLVGMGAWVVSRDEFGRLLLYGGQAAVHPMKLRWEANGWSSVQGQGVVVMPMFGEVSFRPLRRRAGEVVELGAPCCSGKCYPYEDEAPSNHHMVAAEVGYHPYLDTSSSASHRSAPHHAYSSMLRG